MMIQTFNFEQDHSEGYKVVSIDKSYYLCLNSLAKVIKLVGHPTLCTLGMCLFPCIHVSCSSSLVENDTLEDQMVLHAYIQVVEHIL